MKTSPSPVKLARFVCGAGTSCIGKGITRRRWMCCVWMIRTTRNPWLLGTTAGELTTEELWQAYPHRWPVETLFYIGAETTATEKPRAWTEQAVERRIGLGLLSGSLLKAIAAMGEGLAMGPWDKKPQPSAGRLANHLEIHIENLSALALEGVKRETIKKIPKPLRHRTYSSKKQPKIGKTRDTKAPASYAIAAVQQSNQALAQEAQG